jgi:hypothetical protein
MEIKIKINFNAQDTFIIVGMRMKIKENIWGFVAFYKRS